MNDQPHEDTVIPLAPGENPPVPGAVKVASRDMASEHSSTRRKARRAALEILFEADLMECSPAEIMTSRIGEAGYHLRDFTRQIIEGIAEYHEAIDARIAESMTGDWTIARMPRVDRNLARVAVWELDYTDVDMRICITEALQLANEYSTDESVSYLNGLLARAAQHRSQGG